jgi:RNA polymerase sigma factor, sigma-70 family
VTGFEEIYSAYFSDVFRYARTLCKNDSLAEDIASETFFKAMNAIEHFRGDCDIRVWLCQIAKNCYLTHLQKAGRLSYENDIDAAGSLQAPGSIEDQLIDKDSAMQIHSHLHELPEPYKEVFMLRVFSELSFAKIGRIFGKTENWACVTYHRAKNKLYYELEGKSHEK